MWCNRITGRSRLGGANMAKGKRAESRCRYLVRDMAS